MSSIDLSSPMRQSPKGILIIFFYNIFKFLKQSVIFFIAFIFSLSKKGIFERFGPFTIILVFVLFLVFSILISFLRYYYFKFWVIDNEFHLKSGIFNKETVILSKSKIQNVYIKENFLHRLIGVVSLNIESAGDKNSEIEINAIDKKTALIIKETLFQKDDIKVDKPLTEAKTVLQVPIHKLFLEGLTQNHLKSLSIIFGFFAGLYFENRDFIKDYDLENMAIKWLNIDENLLENIVVINFILLVIGLIISVIFSTIKMVVQNFNLSVKESESSIEISKGLLQTMTLTLMPARIQNIEITTNRLKKKLGLHTLKVKQAMTNQKQANKLSIVGLDLNRLGYLIENLLPVYEFNSDQVKIHPEPFYKRVLLIRYGLMALIINVVLAFNLLWWAALLSFLVSMGLVAFCIKTTYDKSYFYLGGNFLTKGSGLIETRTNILEFHKIQTVSNVQNIFHRRRGLASIKIYTASQKTIIPYLKKSDADLLLDYLIYKVEATEKDWM